MPITARWITALVLGSLMVAGCSTSGPPSSVASPGAPPSQPPPIPAEPGSTSPDSGGDSVRIAAVGDLVCSRLPAPQEKRSDDRRIRNGFCRYDRVAKGIAAGDYDRLLLLGDIQYLLGAYGAFKKYYDPYFGQFRDIVAPVPGNHESYQPDFWGYRKYFKARAHWNRPGGYYSYNVGGWHVIAINSMWCRDHTWSTREGYTPIWSKGSKAIWGCRPGDPMYEWLLRDLERNADRECTLAYFHHPSYFWAGYAGGPDTLLHDGYWFTRPIYRALYRNGGDVVLTGHEHNYQRFHPMNPKAELDEEYGFTQFIVGTGGDTKQPGPSETAPQPEPLAAHQNTSFGHLEMTLRDGGADFRFVSAPGEPKFEDAGSLTCHGAPPTAGA